MASDDFSENCEKTIDIACLCHSHTHFPPFCKSQYRLFILARETIPSMKRSVDILILGGGPTGLGAATQAQSRGSHDWLLVDALEGPGGMARTEKDEEGFLWDLGGHVIHSHFESFDQAMSIHKDWASPSRGGWVRVNSQWCPTPIQQSLGNLSEGAQIQQELLCMEKTNVIDDERQIEGVCPRDNLAEYFRSSFGPTLNDVFFTPFNRKQWAWPLEDLSSDWTRLRAGSKEANVPQPERTLTIRHSPHDTSIFPYPCLGTGSLWDSVSLSLPSERQLYGVAVTKLDASRHVVLLSNGDEVHYSKCISTIPLKSLLELVGLSDGGELKHSSTTAIGLGFRGPLPKVLEAKTWIFAADEDVAFHRATIPTNFSASMSGPGRWSILFETSTSSHRRLKQTTKEELVREHMHQLRVWGAIDQNERPVSIFYKHLEFGYPLPYKGRDTYLGGQHPRTDHRGGPLEALERQGILSRGRFGGWRYESSNQDYAYQQGIEAIDYLLDGKPEETYWPGRKAASFL